MRKIETAKEYCCSHGLAELSTYVVDLFNKDSSKRTAMEEMTCSCGVGINVDNTGLAHCELRPDQRQDQCFQQGRNTLLGRGAAQVHMCRFARV
jgi:hypothetical protein